MSTQHTHTHTHTLVYHEHNDENRGDDATTTDAIGKVRCGLIGHWIRARENRAKGGAQGFLQHTGPYVSRYKREEK